VASSEVEARQYYKIRNIEICLLKFLPRLPIFVHLLKNLYTIFNFFPANYEFVYK